MYMSDHEEFADDDIATVTCDTAQLNTLLRGVHSAIETYELALAHIDGHGAAAPLQQILEDHREAAAWLSERIHRFGANPAENSGPWGAFGSLVSESAHPIATATALATLRQGEQCGINEYEEALRNENVDLDCKEHIRNTLIPECQRHLLELDHMLAPDDCRK